MRALRFGVAGVALEMFVVEQLAGNRGRRVRLRGVTWRGGFRLGIGLSALKAVPWKTAGRKPLLQLAGPICGTPRGSGMATNAGRSRFSRAQGVADPGADAREAVEREAGVHLRLGRAVRVAFAVIEWMKHISSTQFRQVRQQVRDVYLPHWPRGLKGVGAFRQVAVGALEGDELLAAGQRLAVALDQFRLVVQRVEMAARAGAEDVQDALRLGREVRRPRGQRAFPAGWPAATVCARPSTLFGEQTEEQRNAAETAAQMARKFRRSSRRISRPSAEEPTSNMRLRLNSRRRTHSR